MIIIWKKDDDDSFRGDYFLEVNEHIQQNPTSNLEETHYMVGSSRIRDNDINYLKDKFEVYIGESVPEWWNDQDELQ